MRITELSRLLVIMPGRFQPWHIGHRTAYINLCKSFRSSPVYIATSNKIEYPKSPLSFSQKAYLMGLTGIDLDKVVETEQPYRATEITSNFDSRKTVLVYAVSEKDMGIDPRFSFAPLKDGTPNYFQPFDPHLDMKPFVEHAYIYVMPTVEFSVLGEPMTSATEIRDMYLNANVNQRMRIIANLYGKFDKSAFEILNKGICHE